MESNTNNGNNHKANVSLVLSTDAKPRLKWTCELHHRFIEAVNQLGGPNSIYLCFFFFILSLFLLTIFLDGFFPFVLFCVLQKQHLRV